MNTPFFLYDSRENLLLKVITLLIPMNVSVDSIENLI